MKQKRGSRKQGNSTRSRESKFDVKQYLIAAFILLLGITVSIFILRRPTHHALKAEPEEVPGEEATVDSILQTTYTVNFYNPDGIRVESIRISGGSPVLPPVITEEGSVFKGWNDALYSVERDMEVHPVLQSFEKAKNVVYADALYADIDEEFVVTVCLAGDVDCCAFSIVGAYDRDLLQLLEIVPLEKAVTTANDEKTGTFTLTRTEADILNYPVSLAELRFIAKREGSYETNLPLQTSEIYTIRDGVQVYTDSTAYDASLFLLDFGGEE